MLESLFKSATPKVPEVAVLDRPPLPAARLEKSPVKSLAHSYLEEYAELAKAVGIAPPDLAIESFKALLSKLDIPIFSLSEVVAYMDAKAAKESKQQAGWEWRPLRAKDNLRDVSFGRAATRTATSRGGEVVSVAASDYYYGPTEQVYPNHSQGLMMYANGHIGPTGPAAPQTYMTSPSSQPYDRTIPLHAVRRIAQIEKEHHGKLGFFVSDYALAPQVQYPDPFLMAVIPNPRLELGEGRFVIDFWDEPGFGIEQMIK